MALLRYHVEKTGMDDGGTVRERFRRAFGGDLASIPPEVLRHLANARAAMARVVDSSEPPRDVPAIPAPPELEAAPEADEDDDEDDPA
jgi:hypothetical protein